jgi:hypothetical protein
LLVANQVPPLFGEIGEDSRGQDDSSSAIQGILGTADTHNVCFAAWAWDTWGTCGFADRRVGRYSRNR